jgi:hypothetical protein
MMIDLPIHFAAPKGRLEQFVWLASLRGIALWPTWEEDAVGVTLPHGELRYLLALLQGMTHARDSWRRKCEQMRKQGGVK